MVRKCRATRKNGTRCNNKALTSGYVCHLHEATRTNKKPEKNCLLFHIHFLYGLLKYGDKDFVKLDNPNSRGFWQHISEHIFDQQVTNLALQSHANRYFKWMQKNNYNSREAVLAAMTRETKHVNRGKYAVFLPHMHMFLRFNHYTLMDMIHFFTVVMINDIPYRMTVDSPVRVDEAFRKFDISNSFTVLQALDSYHINNMGFALRSSTDCSELQQKCLTSLNLHHHSAPCTDIPLISMDLDSYRSLVATCVDALDDSNTAWQGTVPLAVDVRMLIRNHTINFPSVSEENPSFTHLLEAEPEFGDMPMCYTPRLDDECPSPSQVDVPTKLPEVGPLAQTTKSYDFLPTPDPLAQTTKSFDQCNVLQTPIKYDYMTTPRFLRQRFAVTRQALTLSIHKRRLGLNNMKQRAAYMSSRINTLLHKPLK